LENKQTPPSTERQSSNAIWYYENLGKRTGSGKSIGPITEEVLKLLLENGTIYPNTLVWQKAFGKDWKQIQDTDLFDGPPPLPDSLPPLQDARGPLSHDDCLVGRIADYQRMSGIVWIVIGIIQLFAIVTALAGVWNIIAGTSRIRMVNRIRARDANIPPEFEGVTQLVVLGVINLLLGGFIATVFVAFDFFIRDKILTNRHLFSEPYDALGRGKQIATDGANQTAAAVPSVLGPGGTSGR
jgi:hypothetical protein